MIFCYTQRSVSCLAIFREFSSYNYWKQIQAHSQTLHTQKGLGTHSPIRSLPLKLRKAHSRGGRKYVRTRGNGERQKNKDLLTNWESSYEFTKAAAGVSNTSLPQVCKYIIAFSWLFHRTSECLNEWISESWAFFWLFSFVGLPCQIQFDGFCFILLYFILLCFVVSFSKPVFRTRDRKGVNLDGTEVGRKNWGSTVRKICNQNTLYEKRIYFLIKREIFLKDAFY